MPALQSFNGHIFSVGQLLVQEFHGEKLKLEVNAVEASQLQKKGAPPASGNTSMRGILMPETHVSYLKASKSPMKLKGSGKR